MTEKIYFFYDGECPFCNKFAELLELKSNLPNLVLLNARENFDKLPKGYDMDVKGALIVENGYFYNGAEAINYICNSINNPSIGLLSILKIVFKSNKRSNLIFPILINSRRILLKFKGVPAKIISK